MISFQGPIGSGMTAATNTQTWYDKPGYQQFGSGGSRYQSLLVRLDLFVLNLVGIEEPKTFGSLVSFGKSKYTPQKDQGS